MGIFIEIHTQGLQRWFYYKVKFLEVIESRELVRNRQEATEAAIKKAVEIYNEKYKENEENNASN
ncbi:hypothetical protein BBD31_01605 [Elizabethkingia anophelis]|nr:hypothetical protein BBD31_01605 [Elizabethkingia anophelis]MDV3673665.1 hypothetical protein [Elizabethkingia anophelis]MDV3692389.1 hypothetical protein [Elizabethkingia anophelis]OPB50080.1 hypothetical protein BAY04_06895 [Elizabethkingia anophelis]SPW16793.1 Uncharacterised protein [Elizabethkingia anophelis]